MFELFFNTADRPWLLDTLTLDELKQRPNQYRNAVTAFKNDNYDCGFHHAAELEFDEVFYNAIFTTDGQVLTHN